jgi:hypothetical protein
VTPPLSMRNLAPAGRIVRYANCTTQKMFVNEFLFSFSLLVFAGGLFILGTLILVDAVRRVVRQWLKTSSQKNSGIVLPINVARPIAEGVGNSANNVIQRPITMPEKKVS